MKQLEFKKLKILYASLKYTFREETAYWANNIASVFSTVFYNVTYLLFIVVLFSNTKHIAGYTKDEMLLFYLFAEFGAYYYGVFVDSNVSNFIKSINNGSLDLILVKPLDSLYYLNIWKIKIFSGVRDAIPPLIIVASVINWSNLNIDLLSFLSGVVIWFIGMQIVHAMLWIAALPTFWLGEGKEIYALFQESWFGAGATVPYEGIPQVIKVIFTYIIPGIIPVALAASVALKRSEFLPVLIVSVIILFIFINLRRLAWKFALRSYTSASS